MASVHGLELDDDAPVLDIRDLSVISGSKHILQRISMVVPRGKVVALVGPAESGKTLFLRCLNRLNDLDPELEVRGQVFLSGKDIYHPEVDTSVVRRKVGMVFQKPNPFPKSVFENVAFGAVVNDFGGNVNVLVESSLKKAGLWVEVSDRLTEPAARLSRGQQQRLCLARALAVEPEILLLDEPAAELDPAGSARLEELIQGLKEDLTIILVTRNPQQAARISDLTAFLDAGELVEYGPTDVLFTNPKETRTETFLTGRFA